MLDDLAMLANLPVFDADANAHIGAAQAQAGQAAASAVVPPPTQNRRSPSLDSKTARVAGRGQDPPEQDNAGEKDCGEV